MRREGRGFDRLFATQTGHPVLHFQAWLPRRLAQRNAYGDWVPFAGAVGIVMLAFCGLAYSLFPWLVVDRLTIWQAASSTEALWIIFVGACVVLPVIVGYTVFSYLVFRGKATALQY